MVAQMSHFSCGYVTMSAALENEQNLFIDTSLPSVYMHIYRSASKRALTFHWFATYILFEKAFLIGWSNYFKMWNFWSLFYYFLFLFLHFGCENFLIGLVELWFCLPGDLRICLIVKCWSSCYLFLYIYFSITTREVKWAII